MMSAFEYVTVLISIVISLGITQILSGVASVLKNIDRVELYWPHLLWIIFVLLLHIQEWWVTYELKNYSPWRLPVFLFIMIYPINLFLMSRLLFPDKFKGKRLSLREFYFRNYKKQYLLLCFSAALSILYNVFILNLAFSSQVLQVLLIIILFLVAISQARERIHKTVSIMIVLALVVSIIVEWNVWLIE